MIRTAPRAKKPKPKVKCDVYRAGRVDVSRSGKSCQPYTRMVLVQKFKLKKRTELEKVAFSMNSYFLVLTRKNKSREPFLLKIRFCGFLACARLSLHIETI